MLNFTDSQPFLFQDREKNSEFWNETEKRLDQGFASSSKDSEVLLSRSSTYSTHSRK